MDICEIIESAGFDNTGTCDAASLKVRADVRSMCAVDKCHSFGHNWSCPPACGDLEHWQSVIDSKTTCYLVQSVGELEDDFDFETIMEVEGEHKKRMYKLQATLRKELPEAVLLSAGTCSLCKPCAYPDEPCRHPDQFMVSMEAAGLFVSEVCTTAGIAYNHGKCTTCFTSCILV